MVVHVCRATALAIALMASHGFAENNDGQRRAEIEAEYRKGFVIFGNETLDPVSAEASVVRKIADLIKAAKRKGVRIVRGDIKLSHYTISNFRRTPFGKIHLPNTYRGYIGWKP